MKKRRQPCDDPRGLGKAAEESGKRPCEEREWAGSGQGEEEGPMVGLHSEETGA